MLGVESCSSRSHSRMIRPGPGGPPADVTMAEGVGDRPVNLHQKVLDQRLGAGFILNKRFQKPVDAADVHWEMGHRRHMVVEDEQVCDSLQQGSGRGEAQELAALPEEFFIIR